MMNRLFLGFSKHRITPKRGNFLYIADEFPHIPLAKIFDPTRHSFNPLKGIDDVGARSLAEAIYSLYPQGSTTLTVRNGAIDLAPALLKAPRLDHLDGSEEVLRIKTDLLFSKVLRTVLTTTGRTFHFDPDSIILARINRAELGRFNALALGQFLIEHYKGQLVIPDFGFYGRDHHIDLVYQNRLIAGVQYLDQLPLRLRNVLLSIPDIHASRALYDDAVLLARMRGLIPGTNRFNDFVDEAMA